MKRQKVIFDTDPGIDDANAIVYALHDNRFDIKLFSVSHGNVPLANATRNICHILDAFDKHIPVVQGYDERMSGNTEDASFMHTKPGLGGYHPPRKTITQPMQKDCADAIYEVLKQYPKQIVLYILGPHTNIAHLFQKHPDAKDLIKRVIMMGGAPIGIKSDPSHISFNIRTDVPAFNIVKASGLPITMCPSSIGRDGGYFTEKQVERISKTNQVGAFLATTYQTYWEPGYADRRIAVNDISAVYYPLYPRLFKTRRADIEVDERGVTTPTYHKNGQFRIVVSVDRKAFQKMLFERLKLMNKIHPHLNPQ